MFVYMTGIIISIVIMTLLDYSEFGILFGVLVGSIAYVINLLEGIKRSLFADKVTKRFDSMEDFDKWRKEQEDVEG